MEEITGEICLPSPWKPQAKCTGRTLQVAGSDNPSQLIGTPAH